MPISEQADRDAPAANAGSAWVKRRMHHIFARDGRAVVVAMDGARDGPAPGLERPADAVARVVAGGVDAIMTTFGMARAIADILGGTGLILALDSEGPIADYGVEQALRFGADAVELKVFPGNPNETKLADLRRLAARCTEWGMPLLAEPIPVSFQETERPHRRECRESRADRRRGRRRLRQGSLHRPSANLPPSNCELLRAGAGAGRPGQERPARCAADGGRRDRGGRARDRLRP